MEEFLVSDQISTSFFSVFNLLELYQQDIVELLKILLHVIDRNFPGNVVIMGFESSFKLNFQLIDCLLDIRDISISFVLVKLIVGFCRFVSF